jgi:DNA repair exonuclease SbcCD nuclease subunit
MAYKIAMISDIHFGCRNNSEVYLDIMEKFFKEQFYNDIQKNKITDIRILGDLFDCRNTINVRTMNSVISLFKWFNKQNPKIHFKILLGNHDIYYRNRIDVNALECLRELKNITVIDKVNEEVINGKNIISFPWVIEGSDEKKYFEDVLRDKKKYDLCLGHFEIKGFEVTKGILDDFGADQNAFQMYKKVFSGHYHISSTIKNITYLGCPYQLTWGDSGEQKGFWIYDIDDEKSKFIPNNVSPKFLPIKISEIIENKQDSIDLISNNFIKVIVDKKYDDSELIKAMTKVESLSPLKLDIENTVSNDDLEVEDDIDIDNMTPMKFISEFVESIEINDDKEMIEKKKLLSFIEELYLSSLTDSDQ